MSAVRVKVCGITRREDALACLELGADFLGFNLWPDSPRGLLQEQALEVMEPVPLQKRVLVDVAPDVAKLKRAANHFSAFQLHFPMDLALDQVMAWADIVGAHRLWLAPRVPPGEAFPDLLFGMADTFLVDAFKKDAFGGTGKVADWSRFRQLSNRYPQREWILAGGLSPDNLEQAVRESGTTFVDLNSGVEEAPGLKSRAKVHAAMKALELQGM